MKEQRKKMDEFYSVEGDTPYLQVLETVQRYMTGVENTEEMDAWKYKKHIQTCITTRGLKCREASTLSRLVDRLYNSMREYDLLTDYLTPEVYTRMGIEEIYGRWDCIYMKTKKGKIRLAETFPSAEHARAIFNRITSGYNQQINEGTPIALGEFRPNIRASFVGSPITSKEMGTEFNIRIVHGSAMTRELLLESGTFHPKALDFLELCIRYGANICIAGATGSQNKVKLMRWVSLCTGGAGAVLAFSLGSWMLVPILSIGMGLLPMWLTRFRQYSYHLEVTGELSVVLSMVTNSYIRTENILLAVEENLPYLHGQVRHAFRQFLSNSRDVDPNIKRNLSKMSRQIDNHVFLLWCQLLIMCQEDINQKHSLNAVVSQLAQDKELYNTLSAEITQPLRTFAALLLLTMACFPTAILVGKQLNGAMDPMEILFTTLLGQIIVVGYAVTALFGINRAIRLSTTIEEVPL